MVWYERKAKQHALRFTARTYQVTELRNTMHCGSIRLFTFVKDKYA
jgi:hypothetical protein